ncbi:perforin-1-like [Archocentrus centrarchus]|uniref:perforin-1-like n=1 Tax=Archocentrus centrarchus TaxID=63155 RepID=UPI0011E9E466|nr:perforin-1-like [Archocentrus centrarchus]
MTKLWHFLLLLWAWSPLCLPSSVSFPGTADECEKAPFIPGYNLGGEGFDIVKMERKGASIIDAETWKTGNGSCQLQRNPFMKEEKQKIPIAVVDWRIIPKCDLKVDSVVYDSVEKFANDSTSVVFNDWKSDLNLSANPRVPFRTIYGGSRSKECTFAAQKSKKDRYTFFRHSLSCNFYRYRMATKPPLTHEFESAVNSLPTYSQKTETSYRALIDTYGTHYITQVLLGGKLKAVTAIRTCEATMNGLSATVINDCLLVEASRRFAHSDSINSMAQHCNTIKKKLSLPSFSGRFNERFTEVTGGNIDGADVLFQAQSDASVYKKWLSSLKTTPDVVQYSLKALHTILPANHSTRAGLKMEVEKYIKRNALQKKCSETCEIGHRTNKRDPCACVCNVNHNVKANCCPAGKGLATLKVFKLYAKGLYGDCCTQTDGSVEVKYDGQVKRTAIIRNNDNPRWSEVFEFGPISLNDKKKIMFTVYDEDSYWNSDLLGQCLSDLHSRNVTDSCMFKHGTFFFSYSVECAPNLGGKLCQDYVPTPPSTFLTEVPPDRSEMLVVEPGRMYAERWKNDMEI